MFTNKFSLSLIALAMILTVYGCAKGEGPGSEPEPDFEKNLVFNFPFSGNTLDEISQQEYNAQGAVFLTDRKGKEASAIFFNDKHWIDLDAKLNDPEGTLALWINPCLCKLYNPLFSRKSVEEDSLFGKYYFGFDEEGRILTSCQGKWDVMTDIVIEPNKWCHLVVRWNDLDGLIEIFVNGKKKLSEKYTVNPSEVPNGGGDAYLGKILNKATPADSTVFYKGKLDEIRRYNIWVNEDEIKRLRK